MTFDEWAEQESQPTSKGKSYFRREGWTPSEEKLMRLAWDAAVEHLAKRLQKHLSDKHDCDAYAVEIGMKPRK